MELFEHVPVDRSGPRLRWRPWYVEANLLQAEFGSEGQIVGQASAV